MSHMFKEDTEAEIEVEELILKALEEKLAKVKPLVDQLTLAIDEKERSIAALKEDLQK